MGMKIEDNHDFLVSYETQGNRELKYYKDIYGNDIRLMTSKEKKFVNHFLIISSIFIVVLISGFFYKAYLVQKEIEERTRLYLISGQSLDDGKDIVSEGGVIVSEDKDVVDVKEDGTIVAKSSGTTLITIFKNLDKNDFNNKVSKSRKSDDDISIYDAYKELGIDGELVVEIVVKQAVTGVKLNVSSVNLCVGETNKIGVNIFPHDSENKGVVWSSSNNSVVTVDSNGVLTARSAGAAIITVTTKDGGFKDTTLVNVLKRESKNDIYLSLNNSNFYVGDSKYLNVVVSPDENLKSNIVYSSNDSSVAVVDASGKITAKKIGKATITARISSENIFKSIDINVQEKKLENIYLSSKNLSLHVGDKVNLKSYFYPYDAKSFVTYTSSDSSVASINSRGYITALKEGITTIVVKGENNVFAKCNISVKNDIVKVNQLSVTLDNNTISIGEKIGIKSSIMPLNASNKSLTYVSNDSSVAVVSDSGVITGIRGGNAIITVTASSGISDSISVKVENTKIYANDIRLPKIVNLYVGRSTSLNAVILPSNVTENDIIWTNSDNSIVKVNSNGIITGVKPGEATVTATIGDISSHTIVKVLEVDVTKLDLNIYNSNLFVGEVINLKTFIYPVNATNSSIVWTSSNDSIIKVDSNGKVVALNEGTAVVRATSANNHNIYSECSFTISKINVDSFKLSHNQILITEGKTVKLDVSNIKPSAATYTKATYDVADENVASVSSKGIIKGIKPGKTTITVTVGEVSKTINVTVFEKGDKVYFIDTYSSTSTPSDAMVIESNGKYAMIDTGSPVASIDVIHFLHDLGVKRLEFILITHFQSDSFGGVYGKIESDNILLSDISVGKLYMKPYSASDSYFNDSNDKILKSSSKITDRRDSRSYMFTSIRETAIVNEISYVPVTSSVNKLSLGDFKFELYNTSDQLKSYRSKCLKKYNCNEDSNSIVTYSSINGRSLYLSGDIYNAYHDKETKYLNTKTEVSVAEDVVADHGTIDIYKASNYGYSSSNVSSALDKLKPNYSVITNSINSFDTHNDKGVKRINKYTNNDVYYAGDGTIVLNIDSKGNIKFVQLNN